MSSNPNPLPVTEDRIPFTPVSTPAIERANRLMSVRAHPGFLDILRILDEFVNEAREKTETYPGWDAQVIVVLKVRQQAAAEIKPALLSEIDDAITAGVAEAREQINAAKIPAKTADESIEQGDLVRQKVLETFEEYDTRVPGSYDTTPNQYSF
jgi:hypothetical protein